MDSCLWKESKWEDTNVINNSHLLRVSMNVAQKVETRVRLSSWELHRN